MSILTELFLTFLKIGLFTFGGGYAMIPLIQREVVEQKHWISDEDMLDMMAIAESTPGPIAINCATFIGRKMGNIGGAFCATLGVVLPSFLIISLVSVALQTFSGMRIVRYAFWGIRSGVLALILKAFFKMFRQYRKNWFTYGIMAFSLVGSAFLKCSAILILTTSAVIGIMYSQLKKVNA